MSVAELLLGQSAFLPAFHQGKHLGLGSDLYHCFFRLNYNLRKPAGKATLPDGYDWKKTLSQRSEELFTTKASKTSTAEEDNASLYEQIGRLQMEVSFLKKKLGQ